MVGPLDWAVELDERWVIIGPNGAGKTSLLRIAAATEHPSSGIAYVLGERLGRVDVAELRARVGLSSSALAQRIPDDEVVRDLVVSAGYAVLGRWRERYEDVDYAQAIDMLESLGAEHLADRTLRDAVGGRAQTGADRPGADDRPRTAAARRARRRTGPRRPRGAGGAA